MGGMDGWDLFVTSRESLMIERVSDNENERLSLDLVDQHSGFNRKEVGRMERWGKGRKGDDAMAVRSGRSTVRILSEKRG